MWKRVAVVNQKGGVGKTTTTANLAASLALDGFKVLAIDCDPQGGLSLSLGQPPKTAERTLFSAIKDPKGSLLSSLALDTNVKGVQLVAAYEDLAGADDVLSKRPSWEKTVDRLLAQVDDLYDVLILDGGPALNRWQMAVMTAAMLHPQGLLLVPVQTEFLALNGLDALMDQYEDLRETLGAPRRVRFILTMYQGRANLAQEVEEHVKNRFPGEVIETKIKRAVGLANATVAGVPLVAWDPGHEVAKAYRSATKEIFDYGNP